MNLRNRRPNLASLIALLVLAAGIVVAVVLIVDGDEDSKDTDAAASRDAAERFAQDVAGDDDAAFVDLFRASLNAADERSQDPRLERKGPIAEELGKRPERSQPAGLRRLKLRTTDEQPSVYRDPLFVANARTLIDDERQILGGVDAPTSFPDCVAVGSKDQWCCSGTLVAPNVVVTAGHCVKGGCANRVLAGADTETPEDGTVVNVKRAFSHPRYKPPKEHANDIGVLVLKESVPGVDPRAIATRAQTDKAKRVRVVGFGNTDILSVSGYGRRRMVDLPVASADPKYGARPGLEFVAGAPFLLRDSCTGDSGGPAYVASDGKWYLAGATSRTTSEVILPCGDGGIYTRVARYADWIRSRPGGNWGGGSQ